jgi:hypothetical protein
LISTAAALPQSTHNSGYFDNSTGFTLLATRASVERLRNLRQSAANAAGPR